MGYRAQRHAQGEVLSDSHRKGSYYHLGHCKKSRDVKEPAGHIRPEIGVQSESLHRHGRMFAFACFSFYVLLIRVESTV